MQNYQIEELTVRFLAERRKGTDFSEIWKKLEIMNITDEHKKIIIRNIDNQILRENYFAVKKQRANEVFYSGLALTILGFLYTLSTYLGIIQMGNSFVIVYGPVIGGISLLVAGYNIKRRR